MDFEDGIDLFFVRKDDLTQFAEVSESNNKINMQNVLNCVPLMLKHFKSLNETEQNVFKLFSSSLKFKNCLVYGKIIGRGMESKSSCNYILDDGTATIFISIFRRTDDMEGIWKMDCELEAVKRKMLAQNKNEIVNSLKNLIFKTKEQIDSSNIPLGTKVLVYGKPTFYRGHISLKVFHIIKDENYNRDIEIYFKDYLTDYYKTNYILTST